MGAMRPVEVVEAFPFIEFSLEIDVAFVAEQLIEFLTIRPVRPLNFTIELWSAAFDIGMSNAKIFDVPMELGLELMAIIGSDLTNAEREFFNDVVDEVDGIGIGMLFVDFQSTNPRRVIDGSVLETPYLLLVISDECQELNIHLNVMTWDLLLISLCMHLAHAGARGNLLSPWRRRIRETVESDILMSWYRSKYQTIRIGPR